MYDELVKSLRQCAEASCAGCKNDLVEIGCRGKLQREAADVIEDLENKLNLWRQDKISCWIPVTEHLPKTRESILGKKSSKVIVAFRFDDGTQGTDTAHTLNGEWVFEDHITVVARTITHWMSLPEPPKEKT